MHISFRALKLGRQIAPVQAQPIQQQAAIPAALVPSSGRTRPGYTQQSWKWTVNRLKLCLRLLTWCHLLTLAAVNIAEGLCNRRLHCIWSQGNNRLEAQVRCIATKQERAKACASLHQIDIRQAVY